MQARYLRGKLKASFYGNQQKPIFEYKVPVKRDRISISIDVKSEASETDLEEDVEAQLEAAANSFSRDLQAYTTLDEEESEEELDVVDLDPIRDSKDPDDIDDERDSRSFDYRGAGKSKRRSVPTK